MQTCAMLHGPAPAPHPTASFTPTLSDLRGKPFPTLPWSPVKFTPSYTPGSTDRGSVWSSTICTAQVSSAQSPTHGSSEGAGPHKITQGGHSCSSQASSQKALTGPEKGWHGSLHFCQPFWVSLPLTRHLQLSECQ